MPSDKIKILNEVPYNELEKRVREVTLMGDPDIKPYAHERVKIELKKIDPRFVRPVSFYYRGLSLEFQKLFRKTMLEEHNIDTFNLDRAYMFQFQLPGFPERMIMPPIIEISLYDGDLPIVMDGIHRTYYALQQGSDINSMIISNVIIPYYGVPMPDGWATMKNSVLIPPNAEKRKFRFRHEDLLYALYRDFGPLKVGSPRVEGMKETDMLFDLNAFMEGK